MGVLLDPDLLGDDPFEVDLQAAHLFKHPHLGMHDVLDVWESDPLFYPAKPPAHWLMVAEVESRVLVVPIASARKRRPESLSADRLLRGRSGPRVHLPEGP